MEIATADSLLEMAPLVTGVVVATAVRVVAAGTAAVVAPGVPAGV